MGAIVSLSLFFFVTVGALLYFVNTYHYSTCRRQSDIFISWILNCDTVIIVALAVVAFAVAVALACAGAGKSAWYKHSSPGLESGGTSSRVAGARFGATPTNMLSRGVDSSSHGIFAATWPLVMVYGVVSYRWIKPPAGIVWSASKAKTESLIVNVSV